MITHKPPSLFLSVPPEYNWAQEIEVSGEPEKLGPSEDDQDVVPPQQGGIDLWLGVFFTVVALSLTVGYLVVKAHRPLVAAEPAAVPGTAVELLLRSTIADVGQFVSGIAGALAFLWIILAYRQQSRQLELQRRELQLQRRELIMSRAALQLQAQELKNSVEQQRELVSVTRQQVEAELEALREQRGKEIASAQPRFLFHPEGSMSSGGQTIHHFGMFNEGASVSDVYVSFDPPLTYAPLPDRVPVIGSGRFNQAINFHQLDKTGVKMIIRYEDRLGNRGEQRFHASLDGTRASMLPIRDG